MENTNNRVINFRVENIFDNKMGYNLNRENNFDNKIDFNDENNFNNEIDFNDEITEVESDIVSFIESDIESDIESKYNYAECGNSRKRLYCSLLDVYLSELEYDSDE